MVTPWFFPDTGGIERHVLEVARQLAASGVTVTVAAADNTRTRPEVDEIEGIAVRRVPAWPRRRDYLLAPAVYGLASRPDWDLVHVQSWYTAVPPLAMLAALRAGTPFLVTPHGGNASLLRRPFRPVQRSALGPLVRRAEAVIALNEPQRTMLVRQLRLRPERTHVIPNGSDLVSGLDRAVVARERAGYGGPILVSPGRLERFKGHHRVLEALPHVLEVYPEATLRILGEGRYEPELRRRAGELGVADHVRIEFFPQDRRLELAVAMASADVGVLMSDYETQPVAVLELAALGVPVVVADVQGLRELAADGVARPVDLDATPQELARVIRIALETRSPGPPPSLPSWQAVTADLLEVYRAVLQSRRLA